MAVVQLLQLLSGRDKIPRPSGADTAAQVKPVVMAAVGKDDYYPCRHCYHSRGLR